MPDMTHEWIGGDAFVPDIDDETLNRLKETYIPLVLRDGKYFRMEIPDLRKSAFLWGPKLLDEVKFIPIYERFTDHYCAYHMMVKPSIAEVFANIQNDEKVVGNPEINAFCLPMDHAMIYDTGNGHRLRAIFGKI